MHTHDDGRRVPNPVAVHVVGEVSVLVAVHGWVHVVGVPAEVGEQVRCALHDLIDSVLTRYRILTALRKLFAVQSNR